MGEPIWWITSDRTTYLENFLTQAVVTNENPKVCASGAQVKSGLDV